MSEQDEIHRMAINMDAGKRKVAADKFSENFVYLPDKEQATKDLLALTKDADSGVRGSAAIALGSMFLHITNKEQAWKDLLALIKDADSMVRFSAEDALGSIFPNLTNKEQATKDLLALTKDADSKVRLSTAIVLKSAFPHLTDKEQAWKDLLALTKDGLMPKKGEMNIIRSMAAIVLKSAFPHLTDKEQATKDLLALTKDVDNGVRETAAYLFSSAARYYIIEKDFIKASQSFFGAAFAFKYGLLSHIKPEPRFYLYEGLGYYYHGRALVSELPDKKDPDEYVKNIKEAVIFFEKSINYTNKSGISCYESKTHSFPICFNIYSALYEYNLSYLNFDRKRLVNIKNYLDNASAQCKIADTQRGEDLVRILEKLTSSLKIRLEEVEEEKKKNEAVEKGKGGGYDAKYDVYIDKLKKEFKDSLIEIDSTVNEFEAPLFKKIAAIEKESLEKLQSKEPKTSWQRLYEIVNKFIKKFWKIIVAIGLILGTVEGIIKNWQFISELFKNLLK